MDSNHSTDTFPCAILTSSLCDDWSDGGDLLINVGYSIRLKQRYTWTTLFFLTWSVTETVLPAAGTERSYNIQNICTLHGRDTTFNRGLSVSLRHHKVVV